MSTKDGPAGREDAALDRLLGRAPAGGAAGMDVLAERIVLAAKAEGRPVAGADGISRSRRNVAATGWRVAPRHWRVAAALAACLMIGILGGASTIGEPAVDALFEVAGLSQAGDADFEVFGFDPASPIEEQL